VEIESGYKRVLDIVSHEVHFNATLIFIFIKLYH